MTISNDKNDIKTYVVIIITIENIISANMICACEYENNLFNIIRFLNILQSFSVLPSKNVRSSKTIHARKLIRQ